MSSPPLTPQQTADTVTARAQAVGKTVYDAVNTTLNDPLKASSAASDAISHAIAHSTALKGAVDAFFLLIAPLLTAFFALLDELRHGVTTTMGAPTAAILNEFLGTDFDSSVLAVGASPDETLAKCQRIGQAILHRLEKEFAPAGSVTPASGEAGAQTFAGYGVNFAIQSAIISIIGSFVPEVHLDDLRELGVEVAQNLGLGRLVRQALRPLVQATIATPYTHQLNARYRPNLPPLAEILKAYHASRVDPAQIQTWLEQQGLSDTLIAEVKEQTRERLKAQEWNILTAQGKQSPDDAAYDDQANGMDDDWIALRQAVLTWQRLTPLRDRVLSEVLPQIQNGFVPIQTLQGLLDRLEIPADEQKLWLAAAGNYLEVPRKRISQAEMLYLYEAAQVNDLDVQTWLEAEGFSRADVQRMLTYFRLKLIQATQNIAGAKAAALHAEHVAYVTDEITGLWSRPPTEHELNYWVNLLDTKQRTKADVKNELKALPTTGPAMP